MAEQDPVAPRQAEPPLSAAQAKQRAQEIAFGPAVFHTVQALLELGLLRRLWDQDEAGLSSEELAELAHLPHYGVDVLCRAALSAGVLQQAAQRYRLSKVGYFLLHDALTQANFNFVRDVCYPALPALAQAVRTQAPAGLAALGGKSTVYQTLAQLPEQVQRSWFGFDHFYSDSAFGAALERVLSRNPLCLMDVGANTGRWLQLCLRKAPQLRAKAVDHAAQLRWLSEQLGPELRQRVELHALDLLTPSLQLPGGCDAIWLSQVLDCLDPAAILRVLRAACAALEPGGWLYILEPCPDRQRHAAAEFCLTHTSLYFTCVANGTSRMYDSQQLEHWLTQAGLRCVQRLDHLGVGHSLFECQRQADPCDSQAV